MDNAPALIAQAEDAERRIDGCDHPDEREALEARAAELRARAVALDSYLPLARAH